jgi:hypothetical protein
MGALAGKTRQRSFFLVMMSLGAVVGVVVSRRVEHWFGLYRGLIIGIFLVTCTIPTVTWGTDWCYCISQLFGHKTIRFGPCGKRKTIYLID